MFIHSKRHQTTESERYTNVNVCFSWLYCYYYHYLLLLAVVVVFLASFRLLHCVRVRMSVRACAFIMLERTSIHTHELRSNEMKWVHFKNNNGNKHSNYFHKMWCWCYKVHRNVLLYGLLQSRRKLCVCMYANVRRKSIVVGYFSLFLLRKIAVQYILMCDSEPVHIQSHTCWLCRNVPYVCVCVRAVWISQRKNQMF